MGRSLKNLTVLVIVLVLTMVGTAYSGNFNDEFDLTWGEHRGKIFGGGKMLSLSLDRVSGSGFKSKKEYLFGRIDMQLKLVAGNSAGTVTAYYVSFFIRLSHTLVKKTKVWFFLTRFNENVAVVIGRTNTRRDRFRVSW